MKKIGLVLIALLAFAAVVSAADVLTTVNSAMVQLCCSVKKLLPVAAMLMIVIAGVIYAAGQMMGAETRARANVWATAALTGAIIAILIVVIAPAVLDLMFGTTNGISNACGTCA